MNFGFGVGDIIAIGELTFKTYQKCSSAPAEFQDLSQMIHATHRLLCSIRLSIGGSYDLLPQIHKASLKSILLNMKSIIAQVFRDLDKYSELNHFRPSVLTRAKFAILENPAVAIQKLLFWMTLLNTWMHTIMRDSMKDPKPNSYDPLDVVSLADMKTESDEEAVLISEEVYKTIKKWAGNSASEPTPVRARGIYRYGNQDVPDSTLGDDSTEFSLTRYFGKVWGTASDWPGHSQIEGEIDEENGTICFTKKYGARNLWTTWAYHGRFTPWGIIGIWHPPNKPDSRYRGNGRFVMWLEEDNELADLALSLAINEETLTGFDGGNLDGSKV